MSDRWTYKHGSRAAGFIIYDDGQKGHSTNDSDPARGQHNSFDLCRIHLFGSLDKEVPPGTPVTELPSYKAMVKFAYEQPEIQAARAAEEFEVLPPLTPEEEAEADRLHKQRSGSIGVVDSPVNKTVASALAKFRVIPAGEFATDVPLEWWVKGVLPKGELVVLYGESGAGKSFLALDLVAAISRGVSWRDKIVVRGKVVYVAAEGAGGFRQRLRAYAVHHEVSLLELPGIVAGAPNLLDLDDPKALTLEILKAGGADVIVIDTLAQSMAGGNENSGEDVGRVIAHCRAISKATGASIILIHHSGKDTTKGARGWSGLRAAADAELEVTRKGDMRAVTVRKMKDGADDLSWGFKLDSVDLGLDRDGDLITSMVVKPVEGAIRLQKREPQGAFQRMVFEKIKDQTADKAQPLSVILDLIVPLMPSEKGARDRRRPTAKRAVDALATGGFIQVAANGDISTTKDF